MKSFRLALAAALMVPALAFAATKEKFTLSTKVAPAQRASVIKSVQAATKPSIVTLDKTGTTLTVTAKRGEVNRTKVEEALASSGVTLTGTTAPSTTTTTTKPAEPTTPQTTTP